MLARRASRVARGPAKKLTAPGEPPEPALAWQAVVLRLARRFGWPPREIAEITLAQAFALLRPEGSAARTRRMPLGPGLALAERLASERRAAVTRWLTPSGGPPET